MAEHAAPSQSAARHGVDFQVSAIPAATLERVRTNGVDDYGNRVSFLTEDGAPLRCCLRDATAGERVAVIAYCPFPWSGPFAEVGPIYIHPESCSGYTENARYPTGFRRRRQIFRAYGHDRTIAHAQIVDGIEAEAAIAELFSRVDVDFVHSRNVAAGCFMFEIRRL